MLPYGYMPDYATALAEQVRPTGSDWMFELYRRYRRAGMTFEAAMAKAKAETGLSAKSLK